MQMVKNIFLSILLVWFATLLFMPKKDIYYTLEKSLQEQGMVMNEKSIDSGLFSLTLNDVDVYAKGIKVANIEEVNFFTLLFYTSVDIENLQIDESLRTFAPKNAEYVKLNTSFISPSNISVDTAGSFGLAQGNIDLDGNKIRIDFLEVKEISTFSSMLKKDEKGIYYETSF